jgi:hypothetical protein
VPGVSGDDDGVSMSNTKAELVEAAHAAGLLDVDDDGSALTKAQLLGRWG